MQEGAQAGAHEAQDRAPQEGREAGFRNGQREGFEQCAREMSDRAHQQGFADGYGAGQQEGGRDGNVRGQNEGAQRGQGEGTTDGTNRADSDAAQASAEPGRRKGVEEANASDATARGAADGTIAGDADAKATAERVDYPRGRKDFNTERQADPIRSNDAFNQKPPPAPAPAAAPSASIFQSLVNAFFAPPPGFGPGPQGPDNRYNRPSRTFPSTQEQVAYNDGYGAGYPEGFRNTYDGIFRNAFQGANEEGRRMGCQDARHRDYSGDYAQGQREGHDRGYQEAFRAAYDAAFRAAYDAAFRAASDQAYRQSYQGFYDQHFEEARSEAYRERYDALYGDAKKRAHDAKYAEMYPQYQQAAYARGRADEAEDFRLRPVRLQGAEITETIPNGVMEPGEALRVRVKLRNFAGDALLGRDVQVAVQALSSGSVISEANATLVKDLNPQSVTIVGEALELRVNESAVGSEQQFRVSLSYQGRASGAVTVTVKPRFLLDVGFATAPEVKEGLVTNLAVRVKNNGNKPVAPGLLVKLQSGSDEVEVQRDNVTVNGLAPGAATVVSFPVIGRGHGNTVSPPIVIQALEAGRRRIGLLDGVQSMPVTNDYRVQVRPDTLGALRNGGLARVEYVINNVSSRILLRGLSLKVTFPGAAPGTFVVVGPNPQYLQPLLQGQRVSFLIPVLATQANAGGVLQVEIQEDGRTVVIDRNRF